VMFKGFTFARNVLPDAGKSDALLFIRSAPRWHL